MVTESNQPLALIALFYLGCSIVSCIGNFIMIILFVKERHFHSPCHYMITLSCTADMLHLTGHFIFNYHIYAEQTNTQEFCYWVLFLTSIGKCMSNPLILMTGIDRFIACKSPVLYRALLERPNLYIGAQLLFPVTYTTLLMVSGFFNRDPKTQIVCSVPQAFAGDTFQKFNQSGIFVNVAIVIVYFLTFLQLRRYTGGTKMKVVFRSILWTVIFVILGWTSVTVANQFAVYASDMLTRKLISIYAGIGVNLACASNIFVFYTINTEYREAIRRLFGLSRDTSTSNITSVGPRSSTKVHVVTTT